MPNTVETKLDGVQNNVYKRHIVNNCLFICWNVEGSILERRRTCQGVLLSLTCSRPWSKINSNPDETSKCLFRNKLSKTKVVEVLASRVSMFCILEALILFNHYASRRYNFDGKSRPCPDFDTFLSVPANIRVYNHQFESLVSLAVFIMNWAGTCSGYVRKKQRLSKCDTFLLFRFQCPEWGNFGPFCGYPRYWFSIHWLWWLMYLIDPSWVGSVSVKILWMQIA